LLSKALLLGALALLITKALFRVRWRELGRRLDNAVNVLLVLLGVAYALQLLWWWRGG
jgi:hypothetical protein